MSKDREGKKNNKKIAVKNLKEKRAAKVARREEKNSESKFKI